MTLTMLKTMSAIAIDRFGGIETMSLQVLPVPDIGPDEILVRVETAGIGVWDAAEREGVFANKFKIEPRFPYVLGSEGSGTVVAVGDHVDRFNEGDRVYAISFLNPKGGFYAEYVAVKADIASLIPARLTSVQAGVMPIDAVTALRGPGRHDRSAARRVADSRWRKRGHRTLGRAVRPADGRACSGGGVGK